MSRWPLGFQILVLFGVLLFAGGLGGGPAPAVVGKAVEDAVSWYYVVATAALTLVAAVLLLRAWRRRSAPDVEQDAISTLWWMLAAAVAGAGCGTYSGALHEVEFELHWSTFLGYIVFVPLSFLAASLGARPLHALARILVAGLALECSAQAAWSLANRGRLAYWDDITAMTVGFVAGGLVLGLVVSLARGSIRRVLERLRVAVADATADPRRPRRV